MKIEKRYKVIEGSESAHCCFCYTVIDTMIEPKSLCDCSNTVCETFAEEHAIAIADALNEKELTRIAEGLLANSRKD